MLAYFFLWQGGDNMGFVVSRMSGAWPWRVFREAQQRI